MQHSDGSGPGATERRDIPYFPRTEEVDHLIREATEHPLGTDFLRRGALDAVASTFGVHAFVVDLARERLDPRDGS